MINIILWIVAFGIAFWINFLLHKQQRASSQRKSFYQSEIADAITKTLRWVVIFILIPIDFLTVTAAIHM